MVAVTVENLTKSYNSVPALQGISFNVKKGETFALLGPNGAGKTTTIEILEGYRKRDGGKAEVLGMDPGVRGRGFRQKIGLVLQTTALEHELNVVETVTAFARAYPNAMNIDEVIGLVGLEEMKAKRVGALSGGQQRRLEIALGIVGNPELIFLDEPTTGLDPDARRKIWKLVLRLNELGKTIVLSSHYMDEVEALAHRLAIIVNGRIRAEGTPASLQRDHSDHAVIRFDVPGGKLPESFPAPLRKLVEAGVSTMRMTARDPAPVLADLTNWAFREQFDLSTLTVSRPSLEDIYLRLTQSDSEGSNASVS